MSSAPTVPTTPWSNLLDSWKADMERDISDAHKALQGISPSSPTARTTLRAMKVVLEESEETTKSLIEGLYDADDQTHPDYLVDRFTHLDRCLKDLHSELRDGSRVLGELGDDRILDGLGRFMKATAGMGLGLEGIRKDLESGEAVNERSTATLHDQLESALGAWSFVDRYIPTAFASPRSQTSNNSRKTLSEQGKWYALDIDQKLAQILKARKEDKHSSIVLARDTEKAIDAYIGLTRKVDRILTPGLGEMLGRRKVRKPHSSMASGTTGSSRRSGESTGMRKDDRYRGEDPEYRETYRFQTILRVATDLATINRSARSLSVFAIELVPKVTKPEPCTSTPERRKVRSRLHLSVSFSGLEDEDEGYPTRKKVPKIQQSAQTSQELLLKPSVRDVPVTIPPHRQAARVPTSLAELVQESKASEAKSSDDSSTVAQYHTYTSKMDHSPAAPTLQDYESRADNGRQSRSRSPGRHPLPPRKRFRASSPYRRYRQGSDEETVYLHPSSLSNQSSTREEHNDNQDEGLVYGKYKGDEWTPHRSLLVWLTSYAAVRIASQVSEILERREQSESKWTQTEGEGGKAIHGKKISAGSVAGGYTRARHDSVL